MSLVTDPNKLYHRAQSVMALLPNYYSWMASLFVNYVSGTTVDLGVGAGLVTNYYLPRAKNVIAVDFNPQLLESLKSRLDDPKVVCVQADLLGDWSELDSESADTVLLLDVLEHFEDDRSFLQKTNRILKSGGNLIIKVPAQSKLFGETDKASGHYRRYDLEQLDQVVLEMGFSKIKTKYTNPFGALVYRFRRNKKVNFSRGFPSWVVRIANLIMPLIASLDLVPGLKGLSVVGIYKKN